MWWNIAITKRLRELIKICLLLFRSFSGGQEVSVEVLAEIAGSSPETDNDLLLAQMLQHEFDKEHDKQLKLKEAKFNGQSKGKTFPFTIVNSIWSNCPHAVIFLKLT